MIVLLTLILGGLAFTQASDTCIYATNVTGNGGSLHFLFDDFKDRSYSLLWCTAVKTDNKTVMYTESYDKPNITQLTDLEEWKVYQVSIKAIRPTQINGFCCYYPVEIQCDYNFTTIPQDLRIDFARDSHVVATIQIFDPQRYVARFEYGELDTFDFKERTRFKDVEGVGYVTQNLLIPLQRIRVVIKSKHSSPVLETYESKTVIVTT